MDTLSTPSGNDIYLVPRIKYDYLLYMGIIEDQCLRV